MTHYRSESRNAESYDAYSGDGDPEDGDDFDSYDCLSDYEDDFDCPNPRRQYNSYEAVAAVSAKKNGRVTELRRHRSISEACPSSSGHLEDNRRDHHNQLERKRRASIKGSYTDLREVIPDLRGSKASRAVILQRAAESIEELTKRNREHTQCVETLTRQNEALDRQIQDMDRSFQRIEGGEIAAISVLGRGLQCSGAPKVVCHANPPFINAVWSQSASALSAGPSLSGAPSRPPAEEGPFFAATNGDVVSSPDELASVAVSGLTQLSYAAEQLQHNSSPSTAITNTSLRHTTPRSFCLTPTLQSSSNYRHLYPVVVTTLAQPLKSIISATNRQRSRLSSAAPAVSGSHVRSVTSDPSVVVIAKSKGHGCRSSSAQLLVPLSQSISEPVTSSDCSQTSESFTPQDTFRLSQSTRSFPLETAVLKARKSGRAVPLVNANLPSPNHPKPITETSSTPTRRFVIVRTQDASQIGDLSAV